MKLNRATFEISQRRRSTLDDAGRRVQLIRNYQSGQPSTSEVNVTVQWAWTADNQTATMTAINAATGNQTTSFVYGTTLGTSDVARNDVLSATVYADGGTVAYLVNRQSERKQLSDQNGTVHAYGHDLLARPTTDSITAVGAGVDGSVLCIGRTYDVLGNPEHVTSFSDAAGTSVVNDILRVYNSFEQCIKEYQEHNGAVNTATSVAVGYQYADGSANTIRQTGLVYPNGRVITQDYGTAGGIDDALSRVANLIDDDGTNLVSYTRIGLGTFVQQVSAQPQIAWSLVNGTGIDPYTGLDQFDQIADNRWYSTATSADLDRVQHGYDLAGNRLYRKNTVAEATGVNLDELYAYDGLYRLARLNRGQLNVTNNGIVAGTESFTQAWTLDAVGNWLAFNQADTGGSWTLEQTRAANAVNEITDIVGGGWALPAYDAAGNTVEVPQPNAPSTPDQAVYDAWNRMVAVSSGGSPIQQSTFDGAHRRIQKRLPTHVSCFFSGWRVVEERHRGSSTAALQFVHGMRYVDDLVNRDDGSERLYSLQDPNWNVVAICESTSVVRERYGYAAYGSPRYFNPSFIPIASSSVGWQTLFQGLCIDIETGLILARNRLLIPVLGRWSTIDPTINPLRGGEPTDLARLNIDINLYAFADSSPNNRLDPLGKATKHSAPPPPRDWCKVAIYHRRAKSGAGLAGPQEFVCAAAALAGPDNAIAIPDYPYVDTALHTFTQGRNCCISDLSIVDHGSPNGEVWFGGHHLDTKDAATLCRYLCPGATVRLLGCWAGSRIPGGLDCIDVSTGKPCTEIGWTWRPRPSVEVLLKRCSKIDHVTGCTGCYSYTPIPGAPLPEIDPSCCPKNYPPPTCGGSLYSFRRP